MFIFCNGAEGLLLNKNTKAVTMSKAAIHGKIIATMAPLESPLELLLLL